MGVSLFYVQPRKYAIAAKGTSDELAQAIEPGVTRLRQGEGEEEAAIAV